MACNVLDESLKNYLGRLIRYLGSSASGKDSNGSNQFELEIEKINTDTFKRNVRWKKRLFFFSFPLCSVASVLGEVDPVRHILVGLKVKPIISSSFYALLSVFALSNVSHQVLDSIIWRSLNRLLVIQNGHQTLFAQIRSVFRLIIWLCKGIVTKMIQVQLSANLDEGKSYIVV